jgi:hypothetical protein
VSLSNGKSASACPECKEKHSDWHQRVQSSPPADDQSTYESA